MTPEERKTALAERDAALTALPAINDAKIARANAALATEPKGGS